MKTLIKAAAALVFAVTISMSCQNRPTSADSASAVLENIATRTSIRQFTDTPLTESEIETLLKAGMAAPTAINYQPWHFIVVTDPEVRSSLVSGRVNTMYAQAPCLIVVCGEVNWIRRGRDGEEPVEMENGNWAVDCALAGENILLAAHALGLGGVWTACYPYPDRYELVKEKLGIPDKVMPLTVLALGHPAENPEPKDKWKPEKIHNERW